ncbi:MAG: hypothetical protein L6R48_07120 [Planctomycetes bacterium]|nr:hypothetical protein [Planctomycetota bacterium]
MKRITDMTVAEYQRIAKRMDKRFSADKRWEDLPLQHAPGRPRKGEKRERLEVHSIKMTPDEWTALQAEAKLLGITVNTLVRSVLRPGTLPQIVEAAGLTG